MDVDGFHDPQFDDLVSGGLVLTAHEPANNSPIAGSKLHALPYMAMTPYSIVP